MPERLGYESELVQTNAARSRWSGYEQFEGIYFSRRLDSSELLWALLVLSEHRLR